MKIFFDTEFIEDGKTIELVSIGAVREDGATYYAESYDSMVWWDDADDWVKENVISRLKCNNTSEYCPELKTRNEIREDLLEFVGENPEFWAYFADYDWVVLCQLYGRMIDLPNGWPMFCRDVKQLHVELGSPKLPPQENEHFALDDAIWTKKAYDSLSTYRILNNFFTKTPSEEI